jgi:hypothetical protein
MRRDAFCGLLVCGTAIIDPSWLEFDLWIDLMFQSWRPFVLVCFPGLFKSARTCRNGDHRKPLNTFSISIINIHLTMATTMQPQSQGQQASGQIIQQYRELVKESQQLAQKVSELETDRNEHKLVEDTLGPLDPSRKAYRLVGEVLVERTVQEVLPSVISNRTNVSLIL